MEMMNFDKKGNREETVNYITFAHYYDWLTNMATNVFEWVGLPDTIPEWFIEKTLYERGKAIFFNDPTLGLLCLPAAGNGTKNVYGEDIAFQANSYGHHFYVPANEGVLIWNNNTKSPTREIVRAFAGRLSQVERITDTNLNAQKTPVLLIGEEKSILSLKNIYKKYAGNEPVIFGDKNFMNQDTIRAVSTQAPYVVDKLDVHKQNLWNEALTFLGIKSANTDKRERLITAEVEANDQNIQSNLDIMLNARQRAAEAINTMFGLSIEVKVRGEEEDPRNQNDSRGEAMSKEKEVEKE